MGLDWMVGCGVGAGVGVGVGAWWAELSLQLHGDVTSRPQDSARGEQVHTLLNAA